MQEMDAEMVDLMNMAHFLHAFLQIHEDSGLFNQHIWQGLIM